MDNHLFLKKIMDFIPIGERTTSTDFSILCNTSNLEEIQKIAFLDSRGKKIFPDGSPNFTAALLADAWKKKEEKYLILTRTHASTTFFTLINFLENIQIKTPYLLTNMGFVDFTPKKKNVVDDIIFQAEPLIEKSKLKLIDMGQFHLSSGVSERLFAFDMIDTLNDIAFYLSKHSERIVFIGTHEIPSDAQFERERPQSFFSQLVETNKFLDKLVEKMNPLAVVMKPQTPEYDAQDLIFDGVHFTSLGHQSILARLISDNLV